MKILVAPDSFKGTYSAHQVADAIADGIEDVGAVPIRQPAPQNLPLRMRRAGMAVAKHLLG